MTSLKESAERIVKECMAVKKGERVLIISDRTTKEIADALYDAADAVTETVLMRIPFTGEHGKEPPAIVAKAMKEADVIIAPTKYSLTHTKARKNACKLGARATTLPGITNDIFTRTIDVDYEKMSSLIMKLDKLFEKTERVKIISRSGTNITMSVKGRGRDLDDGMYTKKGLFGNHPAGEICLAPKEGTASGVIVVDRMGEVCKPKTRVFVRSGLVQEVEGDDEFRKKLWKFKNARNIAEFGIGTNPRATITGNVLEDEKVLGTCHIAFGNNTSYPGGRVYAEVHWDAIIMQPTIWFDSNKIMESGELLV